MSGKRSTLSRSISTSAAFGARVAFAATIVLMPLRARFVLQARPVVQVYADFTDFLVFASDVSVLILLTLWCVSLLFDMKPIKLGPKYIWIPLHGLTLAGLISVTGSLDNGLSFYHVLRVVILFYFYLYVVNEIRSADLIIACVVVLIISESIFAIMQFSTQSSLGLQSLGEHKLDPAVRGVSVVSDGTTRLLRVYALAEHPNILGGCLAFSILLLLAGYLHASRSWRPGITLTFLLGLLALFFTFSRSAWLALFVSSAFLFGVEARLRHRDNLRALIRLGLVGALLLSPLVWEFHEYIGSRLNVENSFEVNDLEARSLDERSALNLAAVTIFLEHPLRGIGLGASPLAILESYPTFPGNYLPPHFVLLTAAMETGVLGGVCYLLLALFPWIRLVKRGTTMMNDPRMVTAMTILLAISLVGLFDIYPWLPPTGRLWQWLAWGLIGAADQGES
jgi:O-antigen ligase